MPNELADLITTEFDAGQIFSGRESGKIVQGFKEPCAHTPKINNDYLFHEASRDIVVWFLEAFDPLYLFGPTGCGKTSLIKELAARLNYPVFEITAHNRLEFPELSGHLSVKDGQMIFQYGPLSLAMKYGGLFLINEIDLLDPSTSAGLNSILDGSPLCIAENSGELIKPHPMFRLAATANTNGSRDDTGLYHGTLRQNLAFMDRFSLCQIGYPKAEAEKELLKRLSPDLPEDVLDKMIAYAAEVRQLFLGGQSANYPDTVLEITFSTRTLIRWAKLTKRFEALARQNISPLIYALDRALGFRASEASRTFLHELAQRIFSDTREAS